MLPYAVLFILIFYVLGGMVYVVVPLCYVVYLYMLCSRWYGLRRCSPMLCRLSVYAMFQVVWFTALFAYVVMFIFICYVLGGMVYGVVSLCYAVYLYMLCSRWYGLRCCSPMLCRLSVYAMFQVVWFTALFAYVVMFIFICYVLGGMVYGVVSLCYAVYLYMLCSRWYGLRRCSPMLCRLSVYAMFQVVWFTALFPYAVMFIFICYVLGGMVYGVVPLCCAVYLCMLCSRWSGLRRCSPMLCCLSYSSVEQPYPGQQKVSSFT